MIPAYFRLNPGMLIRALFSNFRLNESLNSAEGYTMHYRSLIVAAAFFLVQAAGTAFAQQEADEIEEIVVLGLAERYGSGLTRAEFVLGAEDIRLRPGGAEITQALARIPGVQVSTGDARGGSFSLEFYLRGLNDNQMGLSVDGIPTGDSRFNGGSPPNRYLDSPNVGTVRVSQSSGQIGSPSRSALGGFIDFRTMNPSEDFGGELQLGSGSFDFQRLYLKVNTGEIAGGLSSYWSFSDQSNDIFAGPKNRQKNRQHFDGKIVKSFDSGTSIAYRISFNELDDNDFGIVSLGDFRNNPSSDTVNDFFAGDPDVDGGFTGFGGALGGLREDLLTYLNADFVLSESLALSLNPYFHELEGESYAYQTDSSTTASGDPRDQASVVESEFDASGRRVADMRVTPRDRSRRGLTAEIAYDGLWSVHDLRAGVWLETDKTNEDRNFYRVEDVRSGIEYSLNSLGYIQYERSLTTDTIYYYVQDTLALADERLTLDIGATVHDIDYSWRSPIEFSGENRINASTDGVDLKVGGVFRFSNRVEGFAGYSQNFGGIFEDAFLGSSDAIDPRAVQPETSENIDLGLRYVADSYAFSLQWYRIEFRNRLTTIPSRVDPNDIADVINGNASTQVVNQGGVNSQGFEITGSLSFGAFDAYASLTTQESEWSADDPGQGIIAGNSVQDIPDISFFGSLEWSPNERFSTSLSAQYVGDRLGANLFVPGFCNRFFCFDGQGNGVNGGDFLGTEDIEGYWLLGVSAAFDLPKIGGIDRFRVQLNIDNLLDETFIGSVTGATSSLPEFGVIGGLTAGSALDRYFIGYPRTVTLGVTITF